MSIQKALGTLQTSVLSTELNSLADGSASAASSAETQSGEFTHGDFELNHDLATAPTAGDIIGDLHIVRTVDGTNYELITTGASESLPPGTYAGTFVAGATTDPGLAIARDVELPPRDFKIVFVNRSGSAFASSGSFVDYIPWRFADV